MTSPLSVVLFSGTEDKLHAAATLTAGAAAMGRPVNMLLQFWGLDAFRSARIGAARGLSFDAGEAPSTNGHAAPPVAPGSPAGTREALPWAETFRMAKELGEVQIRACAGSLDYLHIDRTELDPLVDDCCGIAAFFADAGDGPITFI